MSNIAVIELAGAQYIVEPGSKIEVNKIKQQEVDKSFNLKPLLSTKGEEVMFNNGDVEAKIVENKKGKKLYVIKFKAKSRYRRRTGHRQHLSVLEILSINGQKVEKKSDKKTETVKSEAEKSATAKSKVTETKKETVKAQKSTKTQKNSSKVTTKKESSIKKDK